MAFAKGNNSQLAITPPLENKDGHSWIFSVDPFGKKRWMPVSSHSGLDRLPLLHPGHPLTLAKNCQFC